MRGKGTGLDLSWTGLASEGHRCHFHVSWLELITYGGPQFTNHSLVLTATHGAASVSSVEIKQRLGIWLHFRAEAHLQVCAPACPHHSSQAFWVFFTCFFRPASGDTRDGPGSADPTRNPRVSRGGTLTTREDVAAVQTGMGSNPAGRDH